MKPAIKANYGTTFHRDGTVSFWNVYLQTWCRSAAEKIADKVLASFSVGERVRILGN